MRKTGTRVWLAAAAVASVAGIGQVPALAAPTTTATISIAAKSASKPVTHDVFVVFRARSLSNAHIKGSVTGATSGQVLQLFAQQFPFKKAPVALGSPVTLASTSMPYSFGVTPTLATRYHVDLFTDASETTMVATSAIRIVYVTSSGHWSRVQSCNRRGQRPVCHQRLHLKLTVPPATLRAEQRKRFHLYFGLKLDRSGRAPGPPKRLKLGAGHGHIVSVKKLNAAQYLATMTFSFRVGNAGYYFLVGACQKDTESTDGLNLPGHHGCGDRFISSKIPYLGEPLA
jgi:hypothetical protein